MTRKSPSQPNSVAGRRPPLDPDGDTVAIPRMGDELNGDNVQGEPEHGKSRRKT